MPHSLSAQALEEAIRRLMDEHHMVGLAACRVQDGEVVWSAGFGWADIAARRPMTPDTIQNVASVSKTVTCAALMQLWEQGRFRLEEAVNDYLPFAVVHSRHAAPITFRHLLTHTSAIADSHFYGESYACGDPCISLEDWLRSYLLPGGRYYDAEANFHPWQPGAGWRYSNVAYGLAGFLVERLSGETFTAYTRRHIFQPLGMLQSGWLLSEVDAAQHAVPYALPGTPAEWARLYAPQADRQQDGQPIPLCLYSFPNLSDGMLRTSVRQLARYAAAFLDPDRRDLFSSRETLQRIFTTEVERVDEEVQPAPGMGLTWFSLPHPQNPGKIQAWGHDGGDPGVNTRLQLSFERRAAVIVFCNCNISRAAMDALSESIWQAGE